MATVYADNFAGLTAGRQRDDALRNQAMQAAIQNFLDTQRTTKNQNLSERQFKYTQEENTKLAGEREKERQFREKETRRRALMDIGSQTIRKGELQLQRDRFNFDKTRPTPAQERELSLIMQSADVDAQEGAFATPADVASRYPTLPAGMAQAFADRSTRARPLIEAQYNVSSTLASAINEREKLQKDLDTAKEVASGSHWYWMDSDSIDLAQKNIPTLQKRLMQLNSTLPDKKEWSGMVHFDPNSGFQSSIPRPSWLPTPASPNPPAPAGQGMQGPPVPAGFTPPAPQASPGATNAPAAGRGMPTTSGTGNTVPAQGEPIFQVQGRDGAVYNIPQSRVQAAIARGGVVVGRPAPARPDPGPYNPYMPGSSIFRH